MKRRAGVQMGVAVRRHALAASCLLLYAATIAMGPPWHGRLAWLEPSYLAVLGLLSLVAVVRAALAPSAAWEASLLLLAALLVHAVVLIGLVPLRADLAVHTAIAALAALTLELAPAVALALLLLALHLLPELASGGPTPEVAVMAALPLLLAGPALGVLARDVRRRRMRAEAELRRLQSLSAQLAQLEEEGGAERISAEGVELRRGEAAIQLDAELRRVLQLVKRALGGTRAALFDVDLARESVRPRYHESEGPFLPDCEIPIGKGPVGWVALRGMPFLSPERRSDPADPGYCGKGPFPRSVLAAPVKRGEQVTGVVVVDSLEAGAFTSGDSALLEELARLVAMLMDSSGTLRHFEEQAQKFRTLHDASLTLSRSLALPQLLEDLLSLARGGAGFDRAYVIYHEEPGGFRVLASEGAGALAADTVVPGGTVSWGSHLMSQERGFILDLTGERGPMPLVAEQEKAEPFRSILGIPMCLKGETLGGLILASRTRTYRSRDQEALEVLATQAAYAVENARLYQRVTEMATTDGLTGLFNHRHFQESLDRELERAPRTNARFSLLLLDIDHFKKLNDTYGHPGGDQVLKTLARVLRTTARKSDVVARYGGEEFVLVLIDTDGKQAGEMAGRIRSAVHAAAFQADGRAVKVTVSLGLSSYPDDARAKAELIECADKALYYSKEHGRDQWNAWVKIKDKVVDKAAAVRRNTGR